MLKDNQYIVEAFEKNFSGCKNKKIVLYGKGPFTKLIIDIFEDYNIIGIMDRDIKSGFIYNKPILSYAEVIEQDADIIIVVARPNSIEDIFRRIHKFCSINHIRLYGINGDNLFDRFRFESELDEDIIYTFEKSFSRCKNKRIVLYGKGPRTGLIVEAFPQYNIVGIMDKKIKEGYCYGKRILSIEGVLENKVDIIISVTRPWSTEHVYNRIGQFCAYNHILLYDVEGNNLFEKFGEIKEEVERDPYFDISEKDLKNQIRNHDIISFDVFDTLIMRKTLIPTDVFYIVEEKAREKGIIISSFGKIRQRAEADIIQNNPNIYDIYNKIQELTDISDADKEWLIQQEISVEKSVIISRDKMVDILKFAIAEQKRICLISDMYLPECILKEILEKLGIVGYEKLLVSCDYNVAKWNGIFDIFKRQFVGNSYLHIGDNPIADGECAARYGIDSFIIKKAIDMLDISSYSVIRNYLRTVNERSLIGLFTARAFNNPFALNHTDGRLLVDEIKDFGYLFLGGLITDFVLWFIRKMKVVNYDAVLFASRDGFLIEKLYRLYREHKQAQNLPRGIYFYTSRRILINSFMETEEDIRWMMSLPYEYAPDSMLIDTFGFSSEEIVPYSEEKFPDKIEYGMANKEAIFRKSKEIRENYFKYLVKTGLKTEKNYAFLDLVSSGTCQLFLERLKELNISFYYMCFYSCGDPVREALVHDEHSTIKIDNGNNYTNYLKDNNTHKEYCFLETVMTSEQPSLANVEGEGELIFGKEVRSELELNYIHQIHEAIENYYLDFIRNLYIDTIEMDQCVADKLYSLKNLKYTNEQCSIFNDFFLFEDLVQGKIKLVRH